MAHHQEDQEDHRGREDPKDREDTVPETVVSMSPFDNDQTTRIHKTAAGDTGQVGRRKAEVFQSPAAAAGHKEIGDEGCKEVVGEIEDEHCREAADSLEGQAKMTQMTQMTQEVCWEGQREKKNQDEAEEGIRGKSVVDNEDTTWCNLTKVVVKGIVWI